MATTAAPTALNDFLLGLSPKQSVRIRIPQFGRPPARLQLFEKTVEVDNPIVDHKRRRAWP
jgi:hypothetical protein